MLSINRISHAILPWLLSAAMAITLVFPTFAEGAPEVAKSPRLQQLTEKVQSGDSKAQDVFWDAVIKEGLPMVEAGSKKGHVTMTFLLRAGENGADPRNLRVAMMVPENPLYAFSPVAGTNLWSVSLEVSEEAMGMYWLAWPRGKDGNSETVFAYPHRDGMHYEFFADPNAGQNIRGTIQPEFQDKVMSVFFASSDQQLPYSKKQMGSGKGTLEHKTIESAAFGGPRQVSVYLPDGYSKACSYPWVLVFDAENYLSLMSTTTVLDNMIAEQVVPPLGAVFIHTGASRVPDLAPNPRMEGFVRNELIPWARKTYALSGDNQKTAVMGFSHGGLAALNAGLKNSDLIGAVIAHSSSAWWSSTLRPPFSLLDPMPAEANELARSFAAREKLPLRFYLDVGAWEGNWQVNSNIQLKDALIEKGYSVSFQTYEGGHDYLAWRETMPEALRGIFAGDSNAVSCSQTQ